MKDSLKQDHRIEGPETYEDGTDDEVAESSGLTEAAVPNQRGIRMSAFSLRSR